MASLLGPQWLCECNASGGAETPSKASEAAAKHFLDHGVTGNTAVDNTEGNFHTVSVYKERGQWLYTISNPGQAQEIAYPWRDATQAGTGTPATSMMFPPGAVVQISDSINGPSAYTVTEVDAALQPARPTGKFTSGWLPGDPIELGSLTLAEANERFNATYRMMLAQGRTNMSTTDVVRGC